MEAVKVLARVEIMKRPGHAGSEYHLILHSHDARDAAGKKLGAITADVGGGCSVVVDDANGSWICRLSPYELWRVALDAIAAHENGFRGQQEEGEKNEM